MSSNYGDSDDTNDTIFCNFYFNAIIIFHYLLKEHKIY